MSTSGKPQLWTRGILLCSLLFSVWTVSLIVSANRVQTEVSREVGLANKLNEVEQSIRDLDKAFDEARAGASRDADSTLWRRLYADYRARLSALDSGGPEVQEIRQPLTRADALVARMDAIHSATLTSSPNGEEREKAEAEFREARRQAIDHVKDAAQTVRRHLAGLSLGLASKWRYLNALAVVSCLLAIFTAVLLTLRQRQRAGRRRTEEKLRKSEEYHNLFLHANDAILIFEPESEIVVDVNDRACEIYGFTREEFIGRSIKVLSPDVARGERHLEKLLDRGTYEAFETTQLRADGTPVTFLINSSVIEFQGRPAVLSINRDITERRGAAETLRASEERYRLLVEGVKDYAIFMLDTGGHIASWNQGAERIKGYRAEEIVGEHFSRFYSAEDIESGKPALELRVAAEEGRYEEEGWRIRKDGTRFFASVLITSLWDGAGQLRGFSKVTRDITERRQAEEALRLSEEHLRQSQKMESVGTLAGGVAHDFNNLLTAILCNTQLAMRAYQSDHCLQDRLTEVEKAANRAATLTRQLLAFSRRQQLERKSLDLNETVADIMKMLRRIIGEDVEVRVLSTPGLATVFADPSQIEQVVMNLAVNARDAMPDGGRLVIETHNVTLDENYCRRHAYAKPGRYARIMVSDTGCGMDAKTKARIFEPFFTTKEVGKGTGLGLSMVYGIVKQHEGLVEVYSETGRGTTFKIYLPVVEKAVHEETHDILPALRGGRETILVAEDEEALRELAKDILEELGYEVLLAGDGEEAVRLCRDHRDKIDLLLLDVVMPRVGGHEAYNQICVSGHEVPIIFMTGYSAEIVEQKIADGGRATLLQKPYSVEAVGRKVREVLDEAYARK